MSFGSKEILAISCSWCKAAYHNKESCFNMERLKEPCPLGKSYQQIRTTLVFPCMCALVIAIFSHLFYIGQVVMLCVKRTRSPRLISPRKVLLNRPTCGFGFDVFYSSVIFPSAHCNDCILLPGTEQTFCSPFPYRGRLFKENNDSYNLCASSFPYRTNP